MDRPDWVIGKEGGYMQALNELSALVGLRNLWSHVSVKRKAAIEDRIEELIHKLFPEE
jgi:hypothetical protein